MRQDDSPLEKLIQRIHRILDPSVRIMHLLDVQELEEFDGALIAQKREVLAKQFKEMRGLAADLRALLGDAPLKDNKIEAEYWISLFDGLTEQAVAFLEEREVVPERTCLSARSLVHGDIVNAHVQNDIPPDTQVKIDALGIRSALRNLLSNAARAIRDEKGDRKEGGKIELHGEQHNGEIRISIMDNGIGIPPEILPRIFDEGFTTKPEPDGHGLGLAICKKIVEEYGGRIEVESESGKGSTFTVVLPIVH